MLHLKETYHFGITLSYNDRRNALKTAIATREQEADAIKDSIAARVMTEFETKQIDSWTDRQFLRAYENEIAIRVATNERYQNLLADLNALLSEVSELNLKLEEIHQERWQYWQKQSRNK